MMGSLGAQQTESQHGPDLGAYRSGMTHIDQDARSKKEGMHYLMVVRVPSYPLDSNRVALESAFKEHLFLLKEMLSEYYDQFTIIVPRMSESNYTKNSKSLGIIDQKQDGFRFVILHEESAGRIKYNTRHLAPNFFRIYRECKTADLVHAGRDFPTSLFNFLGTLSAALHKKHCIFVVDIDNRPTGRMLFVSGLWKRRTYLLDKLIYTPLVNQQIRFASKHASLMLVKGKALARDFGNNKATTKTFLDVVHDHTLIIDDLKLRTKNQQQLSSSTPLRAIFFGRLASYKGIDHSIRAIRHCKDQGHMIRLTIIGNGPEKDRLAALVAELELDDRIEMEDAVPYRTVLAKLENYDTLLATPLGSDTPRSVFDAMSQGLVTVAYDTPYYEDLTESEAVVTGKWNCPDQIAHRLIELDTDRNNLVRRATAAVDFAKENTQEAWLSRRIKWTVQYCTPSKG